MRISHDYDSLALAADDYTERYGPCLLTDLVDHLEVNPDITRRVIHHHRQVLSDEDRAMIVRVAGGQHFYVISRDPLDITEWAMRRTRDGYTRQVTISKEMGVAARLVDKRTPDGRWVRMVARHTSRMIEDTDNLIEEAARR